MIFVGFLRAPFLQNASRWLLLFWNSCWLYIYLAIFKWWKMISRKENSSIYLTKDFTDLFNLIKGNNKIPCHFNLIVYFRKQSPQYGKRRQMQWSNSQNSFQKIHALWIFVTWQRRNLPRPQIARSWLIFLWSVFFIFLEKYALTFVVTQSICCTLSC